MAVERQPSGELNRRQVLKRIAVGSTAIGVGGVAYVDEMTKTPPSYLRAGGELGLALAGAVWNIWTLRKMKSQEMGHNTQQSQIPPQQ